MGYTLRSAITCGYVHPHSKHKLNISSSRTGLSESAWITVSHLVTYHRYLRFLPDGVVLSLLANEHENPQAVVQTLQPDLHMKVLLPLVTFQITADLLPKGFMKGKWYLDGSTVHVTDLVDPSLSRYTFQMVLSLKSRPLGRQVHFPSQGLAS
jgi:F-box protein 9